jgi:hypothetical protein
VLDKPNQTAANLASENVHADITKLIAENKVYVNIQNQVCSTTFDAAQYGADDDEKDEVEVNIRMKPQNFINLAETSISCASRSLRIGVARAASVLIRVNHSANVKARQNSSCTPLYLSVRYGHVGIVLLERGADKHALNDFHDKIADLLGEPGLRGPIYKRSCRET